MIANFLRKLFEKGYKQEELEALTGLSQSVISKLKNGGTPSVTTLIKLANTFNVSTDEILGRNHKDEEGKAA